MLSWSRVDLESKRVSWRYGKRNKLEEQVYDLKERGISAFQEKESCTYCYGRCPYMLPWRLGFREHGE